MRKGCRVVRQLEDRDTVLMLARCGLTSDRVSQLARDSAVICGVESAFAGAMSVFVACSAFYVGCRLIRRLF